MTQPPSAWHGIMVDALVLLLFAGCVGVVMFRGLPDPGLGRDVFVGLLGTVGTLAVTIVNYHRGSSAGSAAKTQLMAEQANHTGAKP